MRPQGRQLGLTAWGGECKCHAMVDLGGTLKPPGPHRGEGLWEEGAVLPGLLTFHEKPGIPNVMCNRRTFNCRQLIPLVFEKTPCWLNKTPLTVVLSWRTPGL